MTNVKSTTSLILTRDSTSQQGRSGEGGGACPKGAAESAFTSHKIGLWKKKCLSFDSQAEKISDGYLNKRRERDRRTVKEGVEAVLFMERRAAANCESGIRKKKEKNPLQWKCLGRGDAVWHGLSTMLENTSIFLSLPSDDNVGVQSDTVLPVQISF